MNPALPCELTQAHIADLHRQAERDRTASRARPRRASRRHPATAHRSPALPRVRALLAGRTRSAS